MGSKSSKEASAAPTGLPEDDSTPISESGVVLAEDLQSKSRKGASYCVARIGFLIALFTCFADKILQDFQSTVLKEEWEKRQKYLLAKNNKRLMSDYEFQEALKERMTAVRQQQAAVHKQLDEKAEALQARFADISIGLQHDADRLEKENLSIQPKVCILNVICE